MRKAFAEAILARAREANCYFLTGDLGFMALEKVREAFGPRFINAGIAEQNMVGVAAGLAKGGCSVFVYSIGPFCYARPFEQIRNDLCLDGVPVCLVGNGGGYAYGPMGPTHHSLEDCAALSALGVRVLVPAFARDIAPLLTSIARPTYLRLGRDEAPADFRPPDWAAWRRLLPGETGAMVALGPLAGVALDALVNLPEHRRPALWAACEMPLCTPPPELWADIHGKWLCVLEEHIEAGGLGMSLAHRLLTIGVRPARFTHHHALRYQNQRYGSQSYHRAQCKLDSPSIRALVGPQTL